MFQVLFLSSALYLYFRVPAPGWAVAGIAVVAAAMSLQNGMFGWQKALWMLIIGVLLVVELKAITEDRLAAQLQAKTDRQEQDTHFARVLADNNSRFQAMMNANSNLLAKSVEGIDLAKQSLDNITGGQSFVVLRVFPEGRGLVFSQGNSNLHNVSMRIVNLPIFDAVFQQNSHPSRNETARADTNVFIGDLPPHMGREISLPRFGSASDGSIKLNIFFTGMNGEWIENFRLTYVGGPPGDSDPGITRCSCKGTKETA